MESVMKNGFSELSVNEMNEVDGGAWWNKALAVLYIGAAAYACTNPATSWASPIFMEFGVSCW
jgi:hypothetical protein